MATAGVLNRLFGWTIRLVELAIATTITVFFLGRGLWFVSVAR